MHKYKKKIKLLIISIIIKMPLVVFIYLEKKFQKQPKIATRFEVMRIRKFIVETNFSNLNTEDFLVANISKPHYPQRFLNAYFMDNMITNIIYCLGNGYIPCINYLHPEGYYNLWETLFEKPFFVAKKDFRNSIECDKYMAKMCLPRYPSKQQVKKIGAIYRTYVRPNEKFKKYFESEYNQLIKGKRVIGVLCRGTDYVTLKPKHHPIQPKVEDVINLTKKKMIKLKCDYIYLATEEKAIYLKFMEVFPGKVLVNKRRYFDDYYLIQKKDNKAYIQDVYTQKSLDANDTSIEYFSSLFLLANCTAFIAGSSFGSRFALYMNGGKYEYWNLFNLGFYE